MTSTNFEDFGFAEIKEVSKMLALYVRGEYHNPFWTNSQVRPMMNKKSGNVFLIDSDYNVLMMNGERLEGHYILPHSGEEGFLDDFDMDEEKYNREDFEYVNQIAKSYMDWQS
jgi:hypothetical protein